MTAPVVTAALPIEPRPTPSFAERGLTASRLQLAEICVGSAVFAHLELDADVGDNEARDRGTAIHKFLADVSEVGRDEALAMVPDAHRAACEAIDVDALPLASLSPEVSMAWNVDTGAARIVGVNLGRKLSIANAGARELVGTTDLAGPVAAPAGAAGFRRRRR